MNKTKQINVRLTEDQINLLKKIVEEGKAATQSAALVYLINQYGILGG